MNQCLINSLDKQAVIKIPYHRPFARGIQQWPVNSPHLWPLMREALQSHNIITHNIGSSKTDQHTVHQHWSYIISVLPLHFLLIRMPLFLPKTIIHVLSYVKCLQKWLNLTKMYQKYQKYINYHLCHHTYIFGDLWSWKSCEILISIKCIFSLFIYDLCDNSLWIKNNWSYKSSSVQ